MSESYRQFLPIGQKKTVEKDSRIAESVVKYRETDQAPDRIRQYPTRLTRQLTRVPQARSMSAN